MSGKRWLEMRWTWFCWDVSLAVSLSLCYATTVAYKRLHDAMTGILHCAGYATPKTLFCAVAVDAGVFGVIAQQMSKSCQAPAAAERQR